MPRTRPAVQPVPAGAVLTVGHLPAVPGYTVVHGHEEGDRCTARYCRYVPTLLTRLLARVGL